MPLFAPSSKHDQSPKANLKLKVSSWFKTILPHKCTCKHLNKAQKMPVVKPLKCHIEPTLKIPRKYAHDATKPHMWVGGHRVPYIPSQSHRLKGGRMSFDPIVEDKRVCDHCQAQSSKTLARSNVTVDDDDDDEY
ncbi:Aste57867_8946 [Aphanomyces stellatus]|uniref:Aste57867_8946 protein n=1 Tax=Aphanomyces stellatus TaxID=120398 RepID=A0A485KLZ1_9STRA|nr:hypothetical protein As57867_008911 [Aphanomyces stellatus]VFT85830.1 Aste57867_8946 [Aphanomyces stellatus]